MTQTLEKKRARSTEYKGVGCGASLMATFDAPTMSNMKNV